MPRPGARAGKEIKALSKKSGGDADVVAAAKAVVAKWKRLVTAGG